MMRPTDCNAWSAEGLRAVPGQSVTASKLEAALRQAQTVVDFADRLYRER